MHDDVIWNFEASVVQLCWPEKQVEISDVLTNHMHDIRVVPNLSSFILVFAQEVAKTGNVPNRSIQPDIEKLVFFSWNWKTKIRTIPRDAPILQTPPHPGQELIDHFFLQVFIVSQPIL